MRFRSTCPQSVTSRVGMRPYYEEGAGTMGQAIAGTALAAFLCSPGNAQSATDSRPAEAKPEFEVASIKPSVLPGRGAIRLGMRGGPGSADPGRVTYTL